MEYTLTETDILMHLESERLKSFENWPFDESCKCTPARVQKNVYFGLSYLTFLVSRARALVSINGGWTINVYITLIVDPPLIETSALGRGS